MRKFMTVLLITAASLLVLIPVKAKTEDVYGTINGVTYSSQNDAGNSVMNQLDDLAADPGETVFTSNIPLQFVSTDGSCSGNAYYYAILKKNATVEDAENANWKEITIGTTTISKEYYGVLSVKEVYQNQDGDDEVQYYRYGESNSLLDMTKPTLTNTKGVIKPSDNTQVYSYSVSYTKNGKTYTPIKQRMAKGGKNQLDLKKYKVLRGKTVSVRIVDVAGNVAVVQVAVPKK